jgi:hypothetical protein
MGEKDTGGSETGQESLTQSEERRDAPVYQKPVLRKYDQIEQVKPYGPSELEAG